ncbi:hypothetical protein [Enterococcus sp. AZ109]|uniref:hypothetical protein n=1 Tax=Enterococcus sp. AZ109 TaxID=2774634 RepID=UPI003F6866A8
MVIFKISDESFALLEVLGVYSYKEKFDKDWYKQKLYEIQDWKKAGLKTRSFVDVSILFDAPLAEIMQSQKLGKLSQNDIAGLINKFNEYNK